MKRIVSLIALASVLLMQSACNKAEVIPAADEGECEVAFTAALPGDLATKSAGDGTTADKLTYAVYETGKTTALITGESDIPLKTTVTLKLVTGRTYDIIFWAQDEGAPYEFNTSTQEVTVTDNYEGVAANDESRDAFYAMKTVTVTGSLTETVQLKRPFAQVNVATDDCTEAKENGVNISASSFTANASAYTRLNLATGTASEKVNVTCTSAGIPESTTLTIDGKDYTCLGMNYLLVGESADSEKDVIDCTIVLSDEAASYTKELNITNVPVQRNYRTNIYGSLLTATATFNVEIVPAFEDTDYTYSLSKVSTEGELRSAINSGISEITLSQSITLSDKLLIEDGQSVILNLGGKTLTCADGDETEGTSGNGVIWVRKGMLTIKGSGTVNGGKGTEHATIAAFGSESKVIINSSATFKVGGEGNSDYGNYNNVVYASKGAQVEIYNGTFTSSDVQKGTDDFYAVLNVYNSDPGTIKVYGGTFTNYDPATGDDNLGGSFVADGYASVKTSADPDKYKVIEYSTSLSSSGTVAVNNAVNLESQLVCTKKLYLNLGESATVTVTDNSSAVLRVSGTSSTAIITGSGTIYGPEVTDAGLHAAIWSISKSGKTTIEGVSVYNSDDNPTGSVSACVCVGPASSGAYTCGTVTINSGYFYTYNDADGKPNPCVYLLYGTAKSECTVNIYGGIFESESDDNPYLINIHDSSNQNYTKVNIYGGTFVGFNPADNNDTATFGSFVADGYESVETTYNGRKAWTVQKAS